MLQSNHHRLFSDLQNCISTYLDQLAAQKEVLLSGSTDDLNQLTRQKQATASRLSNLAGQALPALKAFKQQASESRAAYAPETARNLHQRLQECQLKSAENAALLATRLKHTTNTLHQLHSLLNSAQPITYSQDGREKYTAQPRQSVHA